MVGIEQRNAEQEALARSKIMKLWAPGNLFHNFSRYPYRGRQIDRLAGILERGLIPPALDRKRVVSDLDIRTSGFSKPYDSVVFLHRFNENSWLYTPKNSETISCFVDRSTPVLIYKDMERGWAVLCRDEVYVDGVVPAERILGLAVAPNKVEAVLKEFLAQFQRLAIPLYDFSGRVHWPR